MMEPHPTTTALVQMVGDFECATGIKAVLEEVPYDNQVAKVLLTFTGKSSDYDILFDDQVFHAFGYEQAGYIEPLDSYVKDPATNMDTKLDDFAPGLIDGVKVDGKLYGLPMYADSSLFMYRKDLFEARGIKVPTTFQEIYDAAKALNNPPEMNGITLRGRRGIHLAWLWGHFLKAYGGDYLDKAGNPSLDTPQAVAAAKAYLDLMQFGPKDASNYGWEENRIAFSQGKAAMTIDASVNAAYNEDPKQSTVVGKVGYAVIPKGPGGYGINISLHALYISTFSKHKAEAYKFISWATSTPTQTKIMELQPSPSLTSQPVLMSKAFQDKYGVFAKAQLDSLALGNLDYVPHVQQSNEITDALAIQLSLALTEGKDVNEAMKQANADEARILGK